MKRFFLYIAFTSIVASGFSQKRMTRGEYLEKYAPIAIKEMQRTGIPASITLAQACLESDNGNSTLTLEGNNHFGIKCHSTWDGKKIYFDDDTKNECFRVYPAALDSYIDHSEFIKNGQRYSFLFNLPQSDYKSWAYGLKEAGYATNPNYAELLIRIIEDNELNKYDKPELYAMTIFSQEQTNGDALKFVEVNAPDPTVNPPKPTENKSIRTKYNREIYKNNGVEFVILKENETIFMISKKFSIPVWKIYYFNDFKPGQALAAGDIIYLQPKKSGAEKPYVTHKVVTNDDLHSVSQLYGIKLIKLCKMNNTSRDNPLKVGSNIYVKKNIVLFQ